MSVERVGESGAGMARSSYLDRYMHGDHERVWSELFAYGHDVRNQSLFLDALSVARETMTRVRWNLEQIIYRLNTLGYEFRHVEWMSDPLGLPDSTIQPNLAQMETMYGHFPLSLRCWYEVVGAVDLNGSHPSWPPQCYPDPLTIWRLPKTPLKELSEVYGPLEGYHATLKRSYRLRLAPDYLHKEGVSGGPPYSIALPNNSADAPLDCERHNTTLVNYLRICFRWGGFPGFELCPEYPRREIEYLSADLLPI